MITDKSSSYKRYYRVLTIAGSDSSGGAGVQADIKTISACGCYAASVITAVTVQNTLGVSNVCPVPVTVIEQQIDAVLSDIGSDAIKIGMLNSAEVVECVARQLDKYDIRNIVLDPVMVSTSGHRLIEENAIESLITNLLPKARAITPNIPEAEILLGGEKLTCQSSLPEAARELSKRISLTKSAPSLSGKTRGAVSILLKAGHLTDEKLTDVFYDAEDDKIYELPSVRIHTKNTHGTGCTMSSAFASMLAKGMSLPDAVKAAKEYINNAIIAGAEYEIGHGYGPVKHFYRFW